VHRENVATVISRAAFREPRRSAAPVSSRCLCLAAAATADVPVTLHVFAKHFMFLPLASFSFTPSFPFACRQTRTQDSESWTHGSQNENSSKPINSVLT